MHWEKAQGVHKKESNSAYFQCQISFSKIEQNIFSHYPLKYKNSQCVIFLYYSLMRQGHQDSLYHKLS